MADLKPLSDEEIVRAKQVYGYPDKIPTILTCYGVPELINRLIADRERVEEMLMRDFELEIVVLGEQLMIEIPHPCGLIGFPKQPYIYTPNLAEAIYEIEKQKGGADEASQ